MILIEEMDAYQKPSTIRGVCHENMPYDKFREDAGDQSVLRWRRSALLPSPKLNAQHREKLRMEFQHAR